jgi:hypothetical protein
MAFRGDQAALLKSSLAVDGDLHLRRLPDGKVALETFTTGQSMTNHEQISGGRISSRRFLPVLGVFAGGLVHSVLPLGAFGTYDVAARVAVAGIVAGVTSMLLFVLTRRWDAPKL